MNAAAPAWDDPGLRPDEAHTVGRWLADRAAASGDRIAIDDRGVTISYRDLEARAHELSLALRRAGYGPGDRVATVSGNSIDHVVVFFACAKAGVAFVPLSWRAAPRELADTIGRTAPALLLIEEEHAALAHAALAELAAGGAPAPSLAVPGTTGVESHVPARAERFGPAPVQREVRDDDVLLVIFTSGSESAPKGVMLTHANCFWNNLALAGVAQITADDIVLAVLPQFHVAAWNVQPLLALWVGATVVLERSFQPTRVLQLIEERRVSVMMGVPTQYTLLAGDPRFETTDVSSLRFVQVGGSSIPSAMLERWATRGVTMTQGYGLTEAAPNVLSLAAADAAAHPGAVGRPYPHVEVRLVDAATGLEVAEEGTGELWVRGPSVFAGYLGDPAATRRAMSGAWLRTGDLAVRDDSGMIRIVDRLKDIFISGGENVAPAEVELALSLHPLVESVAVVGAPDPVWGERGVAFVVRRAGSVLGADELLAHARRTLAAFKVPVRVEFVDDLPRSAIDKVARSRLVARAAALETENASHPGGGIA